MTDIPPFPNSVQAQPPNAKHQIQKIETERLQARETNRKSEAPFIPDSRLDTLAALSDMLFLSQASIVGLYFGASAYMSRRP